MDLSVGFQIGQPHVLVPWRISPTELRVLLPSELREITHGYSVVRCTSLGGMQHMLGFHFEPRHDGHLKELEFFREGPMALAESYADFQAHFVTAFGPPARTRLGTEGFPTHEWLSPRARIVHRVQDRFGLEEHMRIQFLDP
jgi:hypothetical protein